jgi:thiamine-phosphate pyrophosphorylase
MMLCLVTDRRRLAGAMGVGEEAWRQLLVEQVSAAASAGVEFIQIREPDLQADELMSLVRVCVRAIAPFAAKLLVSDRLDVALAAGAAGVHLKENSMPPQAVRRLAPKRFLISASVHSVDRVAARKGADFFIAGTVRPTASKAGVDYLNEDGLRGIAQATEEPVLGIGGLDVADMLLLASAGAAGMAAVGAFIPGGGEDIARFVQDRVKRLRFAFDSTGQRP